MYFGENMKGFILVCFMLSVCSCASVTGDSVKNANYHYQMGISYLNDNNIQPAYVEFQKALELNPRDKEVHQALGVLYLTKLEDYPKAVKHFQEALDIDKNFSEAATNLGNAYAQMGEFDKAIRSYRTAVSNPQYKNAAMALNNMGMVYYRLSRPDDALSAFKEALRRYSDFPAPYYGLALCYNAKGQYGDAALALTRAISLDPLYRGDKEKAMAGFRERKLTASGEEEKDISDFLEILRY
jgi:type IV pilus biogenesis/stability protein PilW